MRRSILTLLIAFYMLPGLGAAEEGPRSQDHELGPAFQGSLAGENLSLQTAQGKPFLTYVVGPKDARRAILLIHEWWGLNDHIRGWADRFAGLGYRALAIDLYNGKVALSPDEARRLMQSVDQQEANEKYLAALKYLKMPQRKLATIGWCFGGGQSLQASLADPQDVAATVIYYGPLETNVTRLSTLRGPVLGIFAKRDTGITVEKVEGFESAMEKASKRLEIHFFDADHAFANPSGERYNGEAAKEAWEITRSFLDQNLK